MICCFNANFSHDRLVVVPPTQLECSALPAAPRGELGAPGVQDRRRDNSRSKIVRAAGQHG
jgi:hypothetical protein